MIVSELQSFLGRTAVRRVYFADDSAQPPGMSYVTNFPRLSVPLQGKHTMELSASGKVLTIRPGRGQAVFVPSNAWNRPDWNEPVEVLTFLFGTKQIGISLVRHESGSELAADALKTSIHGAYDGLTQSLVTALTIFANENSRGQLGRLLVESLLHSCLRLLAGKEAKKARKGMRTYEMMCLFVQDQFQTPLTRELVAERFGVAPTHVSRLFRREGLMRFNDYVNLVRVNRAKFMLRNYHMTLKEVAAGCGYSDVAYFCRAFKKIGKVTPTEYREGAR